MNRYYTRPPGVADPDFIDRILAEIHLNWSVLKAPVAYKADVMGRTVGRTMWKALCQRRRVSPRSLTRAACATGPACFLSRSSPAQIPAYYP